MPLVIQSKDSVFYLDLSGILEIKCSLLMRYGLIVRFFNSLTHKVGIKILSIIFFYPKILVHVLSQVRSCAWHRREAVKSLSHSFLSTWGLPRG